MLHKNCYICYVQLTCLMSNMPIQVKEIKANYETY